MRRLRPFPLYWSAILAVVLGAVAVPATALADGEDVAPTDGAPRRRTRPLRHRRLRRRANRSPMTAMTGPLRRPRRSPATNLPRPSRRTPRPPRRRRRRRIRHRCRARRREPRRDRPPASHRRLRRLPSSRLRVTTSSSRMPSGPTPTGSSGRSPFRCWGRCATRTAGGTAVTAAPAATSART